MFKIKTKNLVISFIIYYTKPMKRGRKFQNSRGFSILVAAQNCLTSIFREVTSVNMDAERGPSINFVITAATAHGWYNNNVAIRAFLNRAGGYYTGP